MRIIALIIFLVTIFGSYNCLIAKIIKSPSCLSSDVQNTVNYASPGDTVLLPAGEATWTQGITIEKSVYIKGVAIDKTIITDNTSSDFRDEPFYISIGMDEFFELSDFTFNDTNGGHGYWGVIYLTGSQQDQAKFRIHHCKFDSINGRAIWCNTVYGVVDSCNFYQTGGHEIYIEGDGNRAFERDEGMGSVTAVFFESNYISNSSPSAGFCDYDGGARFVARHNEFHNKWLMSHGYHDRTNSARGAVFQEIYENTFDATYGDCSHWLRIRGGGGVIFNNKVTETGNGHWGWNSSRGISVLYYGSCPNGSCGSGLDNQGPRQTEYPCPDQPGYFGSKKSPIYIWGNTLPSDFFNIPSVSCDDAQDVNGNPYASGNCNDGSDWMAAIFQENKDYFMGIPKPNYEPYEYPHPITQKHHSTFTRPSPPQGSKIKSIIK